MFAFSAPRQYRAPRHSGGFTLVELMITLAVAFVLVALALPSFRELSTRSNVTQLGNDLVLALNTARSEAVRRGTQVEVVGSTGNWSTGWTIKADTGFNNNFDTTVTTHAKAPSGYPVCTNANAPTGIGSSAAAIFNSTGSLAFASSFDINVVRPDGKKALSRWIRVTASGETLNQADTTSSSASFTCTGS